MILCVDYESRITTEYNRQAETRTRLLSRFETDPDDFCGRVRCDPVLFCNGLVTTLDHRHTPSELPFVLYPFQVELLRGLCANIAVGRDTLIEKSRDMGVTWTVLVALLWHWLYVPNFNALIGSRKEDEVDKKGDVDTHFERMRFMLRRLPEAYKARQLPWYNERKHAGYMTLRNPATGAQITGESTNSAFSRQGRYNCCWVDEYAVIDPSLQSEIWKGMGDSTPCRIVTSTPMGAGNKFHQLRQGCRRWARAIEKPTLHDRSRNRDLELRKTPVTGHDDGLDLEGHSLHWTRHSIKAIGCHTEKHGPIDFDLPTLAEGFHDGAKVHSPWYDREVERRSDDPAAVAQELDIAYLSSGYPVFKPEWSRRHLETATEPVRRQQPIVGYGNSGPVVEYEDRESGELWWYEDPHDIREQAYTCGVDASEGLGNQVSDPDYNGLVIWDPVLCRPVAVLRSRHLSPADVAAVLADLASRRDLLIIIERNGPGLAVIATLAGWLTGYHQDAQVFYPLKYTDIRGLTEKQPGFRTTAESKHQLVELIRHHTDPDRGTLLDRRLVDEYTVFANLSGQKMGAPTGIHDDLVMALGLSLVAVQIAKNYCSTLTSVEEDDDALMARLAKANADGSLTDEQLFVRLGL